MDSSSSDDGNASRKSDRRTLLTEAEAIKRKKERKRLRKERLINQLEKKRRKREEEGEEERNVFQAQRKARVEEEEGSASSGRQFTVSVALPGSILNNAQSAELRTYLAGQVARALAVFCVDEVVVFDDECSSSSAASEDASGDLGGRLSASKTTGSEGCLQLARILQYLECPQYLRRSFFPLHRDLKFAGLLNPTDMPHHLRADERAEHCRYREGVVLDRPAGEGKSWAYVGLSAEALLDRKLEPGLRVTVRLGKDREGGEKAKKKLRGQVVSPSAPRAESGLYWGYSVRLARSLSAVFAGCPYRGGYDLTVGTSERGTSVDEVDEMRPGFGHLLVVLGGLAGLEAALEADEGLRGDDPAPLFDLYLNTCPGQGSRTIRTEEALLVTLAALRPKIASPHKKRTDSATTV